MMLTLYTSPPCNLQHTEVNKLHQYVRKDLLEIFVVPQVADSDDEASEEDEEDEDSDEENKKPVAKKKGAGSRG